MGAEWREFSLGELCEMRAGSVFPPALQGKRSGKVPFAKVSDMNLAANRVYIREANNWVDEDDLIKTKAKPFPKGTTAFAKIGEALKKNRLRYLVRPTVIDNNMMGAVPNTAVIDSKFFFYALSQFDFAEVAGGTALPYLTVSTLYDLSISVPPLSQQRAIARILSSLDDKIDLNQRMNETLQAIARALFKSWFVDFDPVRAKATGGTPLGLAPEVAALFPDALDENQMPLGWRLGPLSDVASVVMGASPPGETYNERGVGVPLVNGPVEYGDFFLEKKKWTTQPTRLSRKGDLILCVRGSTTGRHAFANDEYCLGRGVCAIRATGSAQALVNRLVLDGLPKLLSKTTGSVFPNLSSEDIKSFDVVVPPLPIVELYCGLVSPLDQRTWNNVSESRTLCLLRDSLLRKLISGELRVKDSEQLVHEVLGRAEDE
jgi:type I restriction enzyme S subunit